jgi:ABC-type Fe3+/spermidine/putrescine transport system ATPase subunit
VQEARARREPAPEDVYERPTGEFVAGFIGISNLLTGVVDPTGQVLVANRLRIPVSLPEGVNAGDTVNLSVRPEKIAIDEEVDDDTWSASREGSRRVSTSA